MNEFLVFDNDYFDIPLQDLSEDTVIVCHDPQHRCRNADTDQPYSWAVVQTAHDCELPPTPLGLFWEKDMALTFANVLCV